MRPTNASSRRCSIAWTDRCFTPPTGTSRLRCRSSAASCRSTPTGDANDIVYCGLRIADCGFQSCNLPALRTPHSAPYATAMLGLELDDARAIAVRVDDQGGVQARASVAAKGDLAAAAAAALDHVTPPGADPGALGVAAPVPDAPAIAPVLAALSRRFAGPFSTSGAVASGTAAAIAEVWVGAARGVQDAVFFAVDDHTTGGIGRGGAAAIGPHGGAASVARPAP